MRTAPGAAAVVTDEQNRVLLIWRHRFITDTWDWEIPIGKIDEGDSEHHIFRADSAQYIGPPTEAWETERVEWVPITDIRRLIDERDIVSGTSMNARLHTPHRGVVARHPDLASPQGPAGGL
ncbi:NUDIX domain-containing protein [Nonomuraea sp. NPDC050786]|uniref:NUDIX hydrolase n=1 Tax=Nonomuraea sp. NPDC050786 TaxID=3154840 RepID=UPI0033E0E496